MTSLSTTFLLEPWLMSSADELLSLSGASKADCTVLFNGTHEPTTTPTIIDQRDSRLQLRKIKTQARTTGNLHLLGQTSSHQTHKCEHFFSFLSLQCLQGLFLPRLQG
jgi:hypothetical protein